MAERIITGNLLGEGHRITIIISRFNEFITSKLLSGCLDALKRHGVSEENIEIIWAPGAFEIPIIAGRVAEKNNNDAVICLGAVIRGGTPHFEYVAAEVTKGIAHVALNAGKPVIYGIITADNIEQAIERAGTKAGNKGTDAAIAAIEMINLFKNI
ncbi:MAG: 6,7-dimethyl-8-ribityllumazine synthase [Syntrophomonadaceae bacterium]|jgi:6,7-dimethyl-8-ribityllumazine synthase|nr:6,7-dimethyl-8-ribityllumazine synthase [Syntrophomonadaceae bacterium]